MKNDKRFAGLLGGGEYDILKEALYYYDDLEKSIADFISKEVKIERNYNLLEIGIGTGITTAFVLDSLENPETIKIFAVDNEEKMLNEVKHRFSSVENIEYVCSDIIEYLKSVEDDFFDGCYSGYVIHNFDFDTRKELFKELGRTIKSGGFFVNGDKVVVDDVNMQSDYYDKEIKLYDNLDKIGKTEIKEEWIKHYGEDEKIRFTEKEQSDILENNGFTKPEVAFRELMGAVITSKKQ